MHERPVTNLVHLFGICINNLTYNEAVARILTMAAGRKSDFVVTPNVDHVVKLQTDREFARIYREASLSVADGMPLVWTSRLCRQPLPERITGADLFVTLCERAAAEQRTVYLLGAATQTIVESAAQNLVKKFPGLKIVGAQSPSFGFEKNAEESAELVRTISKCSPDLLFVGVGAPKQEKWIYQYREALNCGVALGVGAAFDFVAGNVKRAPGWMQAIGFEWFYRFLKEPRRMFKRYFIDDIVFFRLAVGEICKAPKQTRVK